ncbi:hypothetical protein FRC02_012054 [Tulasnella sp. 418]|nr:hypothetical protein FRC02_012054 [Tulasnella sp. 418]
MKGLVAYAYSDEEEDTAPTRGTAKNRRTSGDGPSKIPKKSLSSTSVNLKAPLPSSSKSNTTAVHEKIGGMSLNSPGDTSSRAPGKASQKAASQWVPYSIKKSTPSAATTPHANNTTPNTPVPSSSGAETSRSHSNQREISPPLTKEDELALIREMLRPLPIEGVEDWDIPPEPEEAYDPTLKAKVASFHSLKKQGKHYNDSLMRNKSFRNPHILEKLVEFVNLEETKGTNFPKDVWDPFDVQPEWYADKIAVLQKARSEEKLKAQAPGQRTKIIFQSSSSASARHHGQSRHSEPSSRQSHHHSSKHDGSRYHPYDHDKKDRNRDWRR